MAGRKGERGGRVGDGTGAGARDLLSDLLGEYSGVLDSVNFEFRIFEILAGRSVRDSVEPLASAFWTVVL